MVDNFAVTAGSGTTVATDDVGGVHCQKIKRMRGTDGKFTGDVLYAAIDCSSSGDNTIVASDATNKIRVLGYVITASAAVNVRWKSGATNKSGLLYLDTKGGVSHHTEDGCMETVNSADALILNLSSAVTVGGHIAYVKEA